MPWLMSFFSSMASIFSASLKLGQPDPESNLVLDEKSASPHPAQVYIPSFLLSQNLPVNAGSVPFSLKTRYCSGESFDFQSSSRLGMFPIGSGVHLPLKKLSKKVRDKSLFSSSEYGYI